MTRVIEDEEQEDFFFWLGNAELIEVDEDGFGEYIEDEREAMRRWRECDITGIADDTDGGAYFSWGEIPRD